MGGRAIPGHHWLVVDLADMAVARVTEVLVDYETAFASGYRCL